MSSLDQKFVFQLILNKMVHLPNQKAISHTLHSRGGQARSRRNKVSALLAGQTALLVYISVHTHPGSLSSIDTFIPHVPSPQEALQSLRESVSTQHANISSYINISTEILSISVRAPQCS